MTAMPSLGHLLAPAVTLLGTSCNSDLQTGPTITIVWTQTDRLSRGGSGSNGEQPRSSFRVLATSGSVLTALVPNY